MDVIVASRLLAFVGLFLIFAGLEAVFPRTRRQFSRWVRWRTNGLMVVLGALGTRLLVFLAVPATGVLAALAAQEAGWGVFNVWDVPFLVAVVLSLVVLDLVIYTQHVIFHKVPLLWRFHRMHHADAELDASTALRFHPVEIVISMLIKAAAVLLLGAPLLAVVLFEIILNGVAMFNHANLQLPRGLEKVLRLFVVTPVFHEIHHGTQRADHDRNFAFNLTWWDYLFRTYRQDPEAGRATFRIGLETVPAQKSTQTRASLLLPFRRL